MEVDSDPLQEILETAVDGLEEVFQETNGVGDDLEEDVFPLVDHFHDLLHRGVGQDQGAFKEKLHQFRPGLAEKSNDPLDGGEEDLFYLVEGLSRA